MQDLKYFCMLILWDTHKECLLLADVSQQYHALLEGHEFILEFLQLNSSLGTASFQLEIL